MTSVANTENNYGEDDSDTSNWHSSKKRVAAVE